MPAWKLQIDGTMLRKAGGWTGQRDVEFPGKAAVVLLPGVVTALGAGESMAPVGLGMPG